MNTSTDRSVTDELFEYLESVEASDAAVEALKATLAELTETTRARVAGNARAGMIPQDFEVAKR